MADRLRIACTVAGVWAVVVGILGSAGLAARQDPTVRSDQEVLIELERRWNEAFYAKDLEFLESILADDFTVTYDDGTRGDKARELELSGAFNQAVESAVQDDFTVRVYRDTAVVGFTLNLVGRRQGERAELRLRYTDVWIMREGRWQCVSSHSTRITEAAGP